MPLTDGQRNIIKNHFTEIPEDMELFKGLVNVKIPDEEKRSVLLAIIDKFENECAEVKAIIETLSD